MTTQGLARTTNQMEHDKFVEDADEKTAVRTLPTGGATSANQTLILTELGQKTEPADIQKAQEQNPITGFATSAKQLPDNHQVTVSNPTTNPETGLATSANQTNGSQVTQVKALDTIYQGTKTVPTGTAEAITTTQTVHSVTVKVLSTNTVAVYIGASGVTVANGFELLAGESVSLDVSDIATIFAISGSASQIIRYIGI